MTAIAHPKLKALISVYAFMSGEKVSKLRIYSTPPA
jgi:hypothetical protein